MKRTTTTYRKVAIFDWVAAVVYVGLAVFMLGVSPLLVVCWLLCAAMFVGLGVMNWKMAKMQDEIDAKIKELQWTIGPMAPQPLLMSIEVPNEDEEEEDGP